MKGSNYNLLPAATYKIYLLSLFAFLGCIAIKCKAQDTKEQSTLDHKNEQQSIIIQQDTIKTKQLNSSKTMVLQIEKIISPQDPVHTLYYTVSEVKTKKIIKKDSYQGTDVRWYDDTSLEMIPYIGMERKPTSENPDEVVADASLNKATIVKLKDSLN